MDEVDDHLVILWTSGDKEVAIKMVFMYAFNAKKNGWWEEITFIVWGPSSKLTSEDSDIQDYIKKMLGEGIDIKACKACADLYGVSDTLASIGIEVKYMGTDLTAFLKSGTKLMTF
ncbi:MAG: DsrE family protein [candidate division Zixibacteria bacterium]|nr:DsrE family protein [candidate division Zixibacteria bacterium]MDH3937867.1 DsrE family protein [candidate division Zixibacteria bacterium]MDH4034305.1 DsrE family protein [candidate division Zixibacteria bacterium]